MSDQQETRPDDLGFELPRAARVSRVRVAIVLAVVIGAAFVLGYLPRRTARARLDAGPASSSEPTARLETISAKEIKSDQPLSLPGTVTPLEQTTLYPRVSGYVRAWKVDIGDKVTDGQELVEIDTPETDAEIAQARAQLAQAKAALAQAQAHAAFSKTNAERYQQLGDQNLVAKSQVEQNVTQAGTDQANVVAAQAQIAAAEANVRRLSDLKTFSKVSAPFAGVVTARTVERGALVSSSTPLYTIAATDPVRIFVQVPQSVAPSVRVDVPVAITAREYAGRTFNGKVARTAGALDPALRTMNTEVRVPNPDGALLPGMYVQTALTLPLPHRVLEVPSTALYNDAQGVRLAVVENGHIHYVPITIERDTGATIQIATGLRGDEKIVKIAVPTLTEGQPVDVIAAPAPSATPPR
ncbi:MAG TPA: efflux RND transporter periplasmic adaptor subunit [Kofleriaceae bacterium]|jgi:RND family efflux transporter MFP subunit|nr:efflux RND transporter periplasmic adaptor subunit [Kofleriaceae bacterium]